MYCQGERIQIEGFGECQRTKTVLFQKQIHVVKTGACEFEYDCKPTPKIMVFQIWGWSKRNTEITKQKATQCHAKTCQWVVTTKRNLIINGCNPTKTNS